MLTYTTGWYNEVWMAAPEKMVQFIELHGFSDDWRHLDLDSDDLLAPGIQRTRLDLQRRR